MNSSDPFLAQLADLARRERTANKWVLVPDNTLGWMLAERLVVEGCNWLNLRFTTPFQLALEAAAPDLLVEGLDPCPENLGPCLVQSLLAGHPSHPFAALIHQPGMAEALWRTLGECRMAGVRHGELDALYQAYLDVNNLADRSMVLQRKAPTKVQDDDFVVAYPYYVWPPVVQDFVRALPGRHLVPHATDLEPPRRLIGVRTPVRVSVEVKVERFYAGRRDLEFQEILDRITCSFDQVEIAAHTEDLPLLRDLLAANRCPVTFAEGLPVALSRPGQAFLKMLSWVDEGLSGFHARELLLANLLKAPPDSWTAARLVKAAQIAWGRPDYRRKLTFLAQRMGDNPAEWLLLQSAQARALADWFDRLFLKLDGSLTGLQSVLREDLEFDEEVTATLVAALEEMKLLPRVDHHILRERVRTLRWGASRPRLGHLHVTSLDSVGLSGRPVVFLTGLEEGRWVATYGEDCVLDDEERSQLHPALVRSSDVAHELAFQISERLHTLGGLVTYSYSSRDRRGEQEEMPSWLFRQAAGQLPAEPAQPWRRRERLRVDVAAVLALFPDLARGAYAEQQREGTELTVYDGWVPSAAGSWDPRTTGRGVSVSRLQSLATCPFQYLLTSGLGLYPAPLALPDPDRWLDPATRGHVLHEVYAGYARRLRAGEGADLLGLLEESLRELIPAPSAAVEAAERESLARDLAHFLRLEQLRGDRTPVGVEVPFGLGEDAAEPLARARPVIIDLGEGMVFSLQGRIDRIDRIPDGYSVVDYKTGSYLELGRDGVYSRGRLLQHALYALAAEQLVDAKVTESGYYFTSARSPRDWVRFPSPDRAQLRRVLELVMDPLASGVFAHAHEREKDCRFCEFQAACAAHRDEHMRSKLDHPLLARRRRLLEEK